MMIFLRYAIISFFSITAVSLLGFQLVEFTHAIIDAYFNKKA
ncbi:hypothetical protein [Niallia nealsonii]|nr:hypothetical protein [Niallia nealsonii]